MAQTIYVFEQSQLEDLLKGCIDMFQEYRDHHAHTEDAAKPAAVSEMIQGLDAERFLANEDPRFIVTTQIIPTQEYEPEEPEDTTDEAPFHGMAPYGGIGILCQF